MIYFITEEQRRMTHGTCYFEFQKGTFRNEFWKDDSLLLHMNIFDRLDLSSVFTATIPDFDYYGVTHVAPEQYAALKATVQTQNDETATLFSELDIWATECFKIYNCFTILGI